jgi:hypothetical protein
METIQHNMGFFLNSNWLMMHMARQTFCGFNHFNVKIYGDCSLTCTTGVNGIVHTSIHPFIWEEEIIFFGWRLQVRSRRWWRSPNTKTFSFFIQCLFAEGAGVRNTYTIHQINSRYIRILIYKSLGMAKYYEMGHSQLGS